ncbi:MAG: hypothetical protein PHF25_06715 [Candidatus Margulisbacteria bacterium]|nr:hypothetical protein [Candidatus Margulisiibacteriota bacterium]
MKKIILLIGILACMNTTIFGFATLTAPVGGDPILFASNVNDVDVYLNGKMIGKKTNTDFTYKVLRDGEDKIFTFKKAGYSDTTVVLQKTMAPVFWLNFIIGGVWGSSTDSLSTKNNMQYSPNQYYVEMNKL